MTQPSHQADSFSVLGIAPKILDVLTRLGFSVPTPIKTKAIPEGLLGKDVVGIAQTGTGKTLAFGLPMIQRLAVHKGQGLIVVPTRELALQVDETLRKVGAPLGLKTAVVIGGASMYVQINRLRQHPHIIVATPGRLVDHMQQKTISLGSVRVVVLDEADRMFDIGFAPQIKQILSALPAGERQTMLFSATMPGPIAAIAAKYMKQPVRIEVAPAGTASANVAQEIYLASRDVKMQLLDKLLSDNTGSVLVFSRTKHGAKKIALAVRSMGHAAAEIHSSRSLAQRRAALEGFKSGTFRVLVATDIAARGIDVRNISLVVNYDLPENSEDYVHRIGRTGRAGQSGRAVSFALPEERSNIREIERLIRRAIPIVPLPILPPRRPVPIVAHAPQQSGFRGRGGRNQWQKSGQRNRNFSGRRRG